jgi:hypothetical protein
LVFFLAQKNTTFFFGIFVHLGGIYHFVVRMSESLEGLTRSIAIAVIKSIANLPPSLFGLSSSMEEPRPKRPKVERNSNRQRVSAWLNDLNTLDFSRADTYASKDFRSMNRIPHSMFLNIVASADRWFPPSVDALGVQSQPNSIKVLSVLRYLATGVAAQYTAEASGLSAKTISAYLPLFLQKFVAEYGVYLYKYLFILTYHQYLINY